MSWAAGYRRTLLRSAIGFYVVTALSYLFPVVYVAVCTRLLRAEAFGELEFFTSIAIVASGIVEFGLTIFAQREAIAQERGNGRLAQIAWTVLLVQAVLGASLLLFAAVGATWIETSGGNGQMLLMAAGYAAVKGMFPSWFYLAKGQSWRLAIIQAANYVTVLVAILLASEAPSSFGVFGWLTLGSVVALVLAVGDIAAQIGLTSPSRGDALRIVRTAAPLAAFVVFSGLYGYGNTFFAGLFVGTQELAEFAVADRINRAALGLTGPLGLVLFPEITRRVTSAPEHASAFAQRVLLAYAVLGAILFASINIFSEGLVGLLSGGRFGGATLFVAVISINILVSCCSRALGVLWLLPNKRDKEFTAIVICGGVIYLGLVMALGPGMGGFGVAVAYLGCEICILLMLMAVSGRIRAP